SLTSGTLTKRHRILHGLLPFDCKFVEVHNISCLKLFTRYNLQKICHIEHKFLQENAKKFLKH
ncbi:MAG: hypothetical protein IKS00_07780, partial [Bacteroidales bacterium]|nr:hypothetical protein [Bacteroidales bacterium]